MPDLISWQGERLQWRRYIARHLHNMVGDALVTQDALHMLSTLWLTCFRKCMLFLVFCRMQVKCTSFQSSEVILKGCCVKTEAYIRDLIHWFCQHSIEDARDQNSATFDESCRKLNIWSVAPTLEVLWMLLGNKGIWVANFVKHTTRGYGRPACQISLKLTKPFPLRVRQKILRT